MTKKVMTNAQPAELIMQPLVPTDHSKRAGVKVEGHITGSLQHDKSGTIPDQPDTHHHLGLNSDFTLDVLAEHLKQEIHKQTEEKRPNQNDQQKQPDQGGAVVHDVQVQSHSEYKIGVDAKASVALSDEETSRLNSGQLHDVLRAQIEANAAATFSADGLRRVLRVVKAHGRTLVIMAAIFVPPIINGIAQGLRPHEAIIYGILNLPTAGSTDHLAASSVHEAVTQISQGHLPDALHNMGDELLSLYSGRIPDFFVEAGIFAAVSKGIEKVVHWNREKRESSEKGTTPINLTGEKIFLIGGDSSVIVDELDDDPDTIYSSRCVPIFRGEEGGKGIVEHHKKQVKRGEGVFLNLEIDRTDSMTDSDNWETLKVSESNLVPGKNGEKYLLVVGFGEIANQEISTRVDVRLGDLQSAATELQDLYEHKHIQTTPIRIYFGNGHTPHKNYETGELDTTMREAALSNFYNVDLFVDITGLIRKALISKIPANQRSIRLYSEQGEYRNTVGELAKNTDIKVVTGNEDKDNTSPILVIENTPGKTLTKAKQLKSIFPNREVLCVISSMPESKRKKREGHDPYKGITIVSTSEIAKNALKNIEAELRIGKSLSDIQRDLDALESPKPQSTPIT